MSRNKKSKSNKNNSLTTKMNIRPTYHIGDQWWCQVEIRIWYDVLILLLFCVLFSSFFQQHDNLRLLFCFTEFVRFCSGAIRSGVQIKEKKERETQTVANCISNRSNDIILKSKSQEGAKVVLLSIVIKINWLDPLDGFGWMYRSLPVRYATHHQ